jgi:hypothetical protein
MGKHEASSNVSEVNLQGPYGVVTNEALSIQASDEAARIDTQAKAAASLEKKLALATYSEVDAPWFQGALHQARQGDFVTLEGATGSFAGNNNVSSDRARLTERFREYGLGSVYGALDRVSNWDGADMSARDFYSFTDQTNARILQLIKGGGGFAISGSQAEIFPEERHGSDRERYRQLWSPIRISGERVPAYELLTAPVQNARDRRSSYVRYDWMLLPQLVIPE